MENIYIILIVSVTVFLAILAVTLYIVLKPKDKTTSMTKSTCAPEKTCAPCPPTTPCPNIDPLNPLFIIKNRNNRYLMVTGTEEIVNSTTNKNNATKFSLPFAGEFGENTPKPKFYRIAHGNKSLVISTLLRSYPYWPEYSFNLTIKKRDTGGFNISQGLIVRDGSSDLLNNNPLKWRLRTEAETNYLGISETARTNLITIGTPFGGLSLLENVSDKIIALQNQSNNNEFIFDIIAVE
jgi:hypothetical protein